MSCRLVALLTLITVAVPVGMALAQDAPARLSAEQRAACSSGFAPLYGDLTKKKWLIQHGTGRTPAETCKLVEEYSQAELKLLQYLVSEAQCGITSSSASQMKQDYKKTEAYRDRICLDAKNWPDGHPVVSDFGDPAHGPHR